MVHLASCPRLSSRKATVKETVALSRLRSVFRTDRSKNATSVPRTVPRPVCPNQLRAEVQSALVVAFSVEGDGLNGGHLRTLSQIIPFNNIAE